MNKMLRLFNAGGIGCFLRLFSVIEARRGTWFTTRCPNSRAEPSKSVSGSAHPDPAKKVDLWLRSQIGPLVRRGIPGCLRSAPEHGQASTPPTQSESPTCVPAGVVGCVSECTRENTQYCIPIGKDLMSNTVTLCDSTSGSITVTE